MFSNQKLERNRKYFDDFKLTTFFFSDETMTAVINYAIHAYQSHAVIAKMLH